MSKNVRLNLNATELESIHDFMVSHSVELDPSLLKIYQKIKLTLYKLDMDMPVAGYDVSGKKRVNKYSSEGLGFGDSEESKPTVTLTPEQAADFNEDFMARLNASLEAKKGENPDAE